jgi:hypothetical protein
LNRNTQLLGVEGQRIADAINYFLKFEIEQRSL